MSGFRLGRGLLSLALRGNQLDDDEDEEMDEPLPPVSADYEYGLKGNKDTGNRVPKFAINLDADEEEEEDMPILPTLGGIEMELPISQDFIDAQRAIEDNKYDTQAWRVFIDEVVRRKGGALTRGEAYTQVLEVFPRSAKYWKALLVYHLSTDDFVEAERAFTKANLHKLRNVELWSLYIDMNVGLSHDSGLLWRKYLDYVSEIRDPTRLLSLRRIYQRALSIPMDGLENIWNEYEKLEKTAGEHLAEQLLPEYNDKCSRAKQLYRDRRKLLSGCDLDRLAVPPSSSTSEMIQLDAWNKVIKFELKISDSIDSEQHKLYMHLLYDQMISCFLFHPEVWIAHAEYQLDASGLIKARIAFKEAMDILPSSELVRIACADMEEMAGNTDLARETLKNSFSAIPTAMMFTAYQKFLRRQDGVAAGRRAFSDYMASLKKNDRSFDGGIFISHAQLELYVNNNARVALNVLEYAKNTDKSIANSVPYIKMMSQVLLRLGDHEQLQWLFANALEQSTVEDETMMVDEEALLDDVKFTVKEIAELWEEYFKIEAELGLCSLSRMNEVRTKRIKSLIAYEDSLRGRPSINLFDLSKDVSHGVLAILERFENLEAIGVSTADNGIKGRCLKLADAYVSRRIEKEELAASEVPTRKRSRRDELLSAESLQYVSIAVKELVVKLPSVPMNGVDVNGFMEQLRKVVLPARPFADEPRDTQLPPAEQSIKRYKTSELDDETALDEREVLDGVGAVEDVFNRRQRAKYAR